MVLMPRTPLISLSNPVNATLLEILIRTSKHTLPQTQVMINLSLSETLGNKTSVNNNNYNNNMVINIALNTKK